MKIGQPSNNPVPVSTTAAPAPAKGGKSAGSTASATATAAKNSQAGGVAVTVSTLARTLESASQGETADVDAKKVNSVRSAIQQGTYVVNAEAIADKLLANAQEILKRTRT